MKFFIYGHENLLATHNTTLEFTKDSYLTKNGDCIVGIRADFSYDELMKLKGQDTIKIIISIDEIKEEIISKVNKYFDHKEEIVIRLSDFLSDRTLGIKANKAAINLNRDLIEKLKDPKAKAQVEII
ncbi:DUF371 domain-containing protein [archaeon]|nr:DUF371 domain-containing protein [archaeon]MBT4272431.1 DUF371 domain-containing protein [archaeon]MBT4460529.1 DUF371 domain-containing protein [archaeon]MBT4857881.1 DUF371 domain-containing protein [archaeon]MBT7440286.1 DUF371 domain-containing protein [archaeon]